MSQERIRVLRTISGGPWAFIRVPGVSFVASGAFQGVPGVSRRFQGISSEGLSGVPGGLRNVFGCPRAFEAVPGGFRRVSDDLRGCNRFLRGGFGGTPWNCSKCF